MTAFLDISGQKFGRLTAKSAIRSPRGTHWVCLCDCGKSTTVYLGDLRMKKTVSCGCWKLSLNLTHGHARRNLKTREYQTWKSMIQRCLNPKKNSYKAYGGCGIKVCTRWRQFANFLADMGPRPKNKSIDRYPNKFGNYEPGNCRWATGSEQQHNRRPNKKRVSV